MVMSTETLAATKVKIAKIYALVCRKLNFVTNSVVIIDILSFPHPIDAPYGIFFK